MKLLFKFLIFIALTSCIDHTSDYDKVLNKVRFPFAKRVCKSNKFTIGMFGGGIGGKVSLGFDGIANLEVDEVRKLLVSLEEQFIDELNSNEELASWWDSPADPYKIEIALEFSKKDNSFVDPPYIAYAFVVRNKVHYSSHDKDNKMHELVLIESYDDAYRIVYGHDRVPQTQPVCAFNNNI